MKAIDIYNKLCQFSDDDLSNVASLEHILCTDIPLFFITDPNGVKQIAWAKGTFPEEAYLYADKMNELTGLQNPNEFANLLAILYQHRNKITRYVEVGTYKGATFYLMDAYLRRVAPNYKKGIAIDLYRVPLELDEYKSRFDVEFYKQSSESVTLQYEPGTVCFIDGRHKAAAAKLDFERFSQWSDIVVMHDVVGMNGVRGVWEKASAAFTEKAVFNGRNKYPGSSPMGIGIIVMR